MQRNKNPNGLCKRTFRLSVPALALVVLSLGAAQAPAQDFRIDWSSIDGGGAMFSTGGPFSLGGTIGQPDAGVPMAGGSFRLTGGFWAGAAAPCVGDLNGDRQVGIADLTILLSHFGCPAGCLLADGDLEGDGDVALGDLTILLANFGRVCP